MQFQKVGRTIILGRIGRGTTKIWKSLPSLPRGPYHQGMRCVMVLTIAMALGAPDERPRWHERVADAFAEARQAHKPVLAVLHCPH